MLAVQSPGSRLRGVGRFGLNLVSAMLAADSKNDYVLYCHDGFPIEHVPGSPRSETRSIAIDSGRGETSLRHAMDRIARDDPDGLDALFTLSPFELVPGYDPPSRPIGGMKMIVLMHDLIPFLAPEKYLDDPGNARWFYRRLRTVERYDLILANSEATRADCLKMLDISAHRAVTISGAGNGAFFHPDRSWPMPREVRRTLHRLGVSRPFVFSVGGSDDRKNIRGLIDAFRLLPPALRIGHQLVVTCGWRDGDEQKTRDFAASRGVADALVLTGEIEDADLRVLYQRCSAFAFPSLYEGLGLPLLEAMHCGAPTIGGHNSSQIEVVGDAGLLVDGHDSADIAEALRTLLERPEFARSLGDRAMARASEFTWERSAKLAIGAIERSTPLVGRGSASIGRGSRWSRRSPRRSRGSRPTRRGWPRPSPAISTSTSITIRATCPKRGLIPRGSRPSITVSSPDSRRSATIAASSIRWATRGITRSSMR